MKIFGAERGLFFSEEERERKGKSASLRIGDFLIRSDNTLTNSGKTLYRPSWGRSLYYVPVLVVRLSKVGKSISLPFVHKYYEQVAVGVSFFDRLYFQEQRREGLDPSLAYNFDTSLPCSPFVDKETLLQRLGGMEHRSNKKECRMMPTFNFYTREQIESSISLLSHYFLLKMGDCITFPLLSEAVPLSLEQADKVSLLLFDTKTEEEWLYVRVR